MQQHQRYVWENEHHDWLQEEEQPAPRTQHTSLTCFITGLNLALCHFCRSSISSTILTKHTTAAASSTPASPQLFFTVNEVKAERRRLHSRKAAVVSPRLFKDCISDGSASAHYLQPQFRRVPTVCQCSRQLTVINNYRPFTPTSHIMKTTQRLLFPFLTP